MPVYDYKCKKCDNIHEEVHSINDEPKIKCPECKGSCRKKITKVNVSIPPKHRAAG